MSETTKKHPRKQPKPHSPAPKRQSRQEAEEARQQRREDSRQAIETHIQNEWTPKFKRETATRQESQPDGTTREISYTQRQPHPGLNPQEIMATLLGRPPTSEDFPRIEAALSLAQSPILQQAIDEALGEFVDEETPSVLFRVVTRFGPRVLRDARVNAVVESWWRMLLAPDIPLQRQKIARKHLGQLGKSLLSVGSGKKKQLTQEEEKAIVEACQKWHPICQKINADFKRLWEIPEYCESVLRRKEARGMLAEKYAIEVSDVAALEVYLQEDTPWDAMLRMVAHQPHYHGVGEKTVETLYREREKTTEAALTDS